MKDKIRYALVDKTGNLVRIKRNKYTACYSSFDSMEELEKEVKQSYLYKSNIKNFLNNYKPCLVRIAPCEFATIKPQEPVKVNMEKKSKKAFMALISEWMQGDMKEHFNYFNLEVGYDNISGHLLFYVKKGLYIESMGRHDVEVAYENKIFHSEYKPWIKKHALEWIYDKVVRPDIFKSDESTVYYLYGERIKSCDRDKWY